MIGHSWHLADSSLFVVQRTAQSGRAVFAKRGIDPGTVVITSSTDLSPVAHVILRPYRRETCAQCFAYDRGREWKIRLGNAGVVFCCEQCLSQWNNEIPILGLQAHEAIEEHLRQQQRRNGSNRLSNHDDEDVEMSDIHDTTSEHLTSQQVNIAWCEAVECGRIIARARSSPMPSKSERKKLRETIETTVDVDVPFYLLSGVLTAYQSAQRHALAPSSVKELIPSLVSLAEDTEIFSEPASLHGYIKSYLLLLAILPHELLPFVQPDVCRELAARASHNAFSIRPTRDGGHSGEFLGWGIWPEASLCNHSCGPNLRKERQGRQWRFVAADSPESRPIKRGDELCITYLGGDEWDLDTSERRKRLRNEWGFECNCRRCSEASEPGHTHRMT